MKYFASSLLIVSLVGVGIFGFALSDMGSNHQNGCVASTINGTICPMNIVDMTLHHISAIQTFMLAVNPSFNWLLLLAFLLFAFFLFLREHSSELIFSRHRFQDSCPPLQKYELTRWLALHENSPTSPKNVE